MKLFRLIRSLNPTGGGPMQGIRQITPHRARLRLTATLISQDPPDAPWLADQLRPSLGLEPVATGYGYRGGCPLASALWPDSTML